MANAADINNPQFVVLAAFRTAAQNLSLPQFVSLVAVNYHAVSENATNFQALVAVRRHAVELQASNLQLLVATKGRPKNPKLRAWAFDLDDHEMYVLKLGNDDRTLLFDLNTGKWSWWSSATEEFWRVSTGINWIDSGAISANYGSNIVVGDDGRAILWVLDPELGYDESPYASERDDGVPYPFERIASAQMITRGYDYVPCFRVILNASAGEPAFPGAVVTLAWSDDMGHSYLTEGVTVNAGDYGQELNWQSLGSFKAPGRLLQVIDDGAITRIDGLDVDNG